MSNVLQLTVVERVEAGHNGLPRALEPGDVVYLCNRFTYGVLASDEIGITFSEDGDYPFHGVPRESVRQA